MTYSTIAITKIFYRTGCDQYHFGSEGTNYVRTFNFQTGRGVGRHLNDQHQQICIRYVIGHALSNENLLFFFLDQTFDGL